MGHGADRQQFIKTILNEALEARVFLSASPAVATIKWQGQDRQVIQGEYVVAIKSGKDFTTLAAKSGFTDVTSLGDNFYRFDTTRTANQIKVWGSNHVGTVQAVQPNFVFKTASIPNDPFFPGQWHLNNTGQVVPDFDLVPPTSSFEVTGTPGTPPITTVSAANVEVGDTFTVTASGDATGTVSFVSVGLSPSAVATGLAAAWNITGVTPTVVDGNLILTPDAGLNVQFTTSTTNAGGINNQTLTANTTRSDINAVAAWSLLDSMGISGKKSVIAVLDTGVDINHPDLVNNIFTNNAELNGLPGVDDDHNGIADDVHGFDFFRGDTTADDEFGHGTFVSGVIAAEENNGIGVAGIAHNTTDILPLKVGGIEGFVSDDSVLAAINYSISMKRLFQTSGGTAGANIIAMNGSFGGVSFPMDRVTARAIARAGDANILFVVAAGNESLNTSNLSDFPSKFSLSLNNVITVAATDKNDQLASFSDFGAGVQIAAPGEDILSTIPHFPEDTIATITAANVEIGDVFTVNVTGDVTGTVSFTATDTTPLNVANGLAAAWNITGITPFVSGNSLFLIPDSGLNVTFTTSTTNSTAIGAVDNQVLAIVTQTTANTPTDTKLGPMEVPGFDYDYASGTSFAAPMVAGVLALEYAARPDASAAQLKEALLRGSDKLSSLNSQYNIPATVTSGARLNAYKAVRAILNNFVKTDDVRQGNWQGIYGSQGAFVAGASQAMPSFVNADLSGKTIITPIGSTTDPRALQVPTNASDRVVGYLTDPDQLSLNMDFTDGQTHRVSFYVDDFEKAGRSELFELVDRSTGDVLSSQTVSKFTGGRYLTFDLTGGVTIRITKIKGPSAILNGVFFDKQPVNDAAFIRSDTATRGNFTGVYGSEGSYVIGGEQNIPAGMSISAVGETEQLLKASTSNRGALDLPGNTARGVFDYWEAPTTFDVGVKFADPTTSLLDTSPHRVSLYMVDADKKNRAERIDVIDRTTGALLNTQDVSNFRNGEYLTFDVSGDVIFRVTNLRGPSAVLSGIFLDGTPGSSIVYVGQDTKTRGSWVGKYGSSGAYVVGNSTSTPTFVGPVQDIGAETGPDLALSLGDGGVERTLLPTTSNKKGLQKVANNADRTVAYFQGTNDFTLDVNFNDSVSHRLTLYMVDYDKKGRQQLLQVIDPATGRVIATKTISNFKNGIYVTYDITGPVQLKLTREAGPNAVLSGVFFD